MKAREIVLAALAVIGAMVLYLGATFGLLWIYASWGAMCRESDGKVAGSGLETHCEHESRGRR